MSFPQSLSNVLSKIHSSEFINIWLPSATVVEQKFQLINIKCKRIRAKVTFRWNVHVVQDEHRTSFNSFMHVSAV